MKTSSIGGAVQWQTRPHSLCCRDIPVISTHQSSLPGCCPTPNTHPGTSHSPLHPSAALLLHPCPDVPGSTWTSIRGRDLTESSYAAPSYSYIQILEIPQVCILTSVHFTSKCGPFYTSHLKNNERERERGSQRMKPSFLLPVNILSQQTPAMQTALGETGGSWNCLNCNTDTTGNKTTCTSRRAMLQHSPQSTCLCASEGDETNSAFFADKGVRLLCPH